MFEFVSECTNGAAFAAERMLDGLPNRPAALRRRASSCSSVKPNSELISCARDM